MTLRERVERHGEPAVLLAADGRDEVVTRSNEVGRARTRRGDELTERAPESPRLGVARFVRSETACAGEQADAVRRHPGLDTDATRRGRTSERAHDERRF